MKDEHLSVSAFDQLDSVPSLSIEDTMGWHPDVDGNEAAFKRDTSKQHPSLVVNGFVKFALAELQRRGGMRDRLEIITTWWHDRTEALCAPLIERLSGRGLERSVRNTLKEQLALEADPMFLGFYSNEVSPKPADGSLHSSGMSVALHDALVQAFETRVKGIKRPCLAKRYPAKRKSRPKR